MGPTGAAQHTTLSCLLRGQAWTMPFATSPRAKGSKGKKKDSVAWASDTMSAADQQRQQQPQQAEEMAPFSSNGITASPYSSNTSGATERMRTLDMDPEAVSHVSRGGSGMGQAQGVIVGSSPEFG